MKILLASGDLQARTRVEAAAERLGHELEVAAAVGFGSRLDSDIDLLILDLDAGRDAAIAEIAAAGDEPPRRVLGFYSHVDTALAQHAAEAGVETVRRGAFWREIDEVIGP